MDRSAIIERIKIKLDEYVPVDEGISHPLDSYINPLLDEAAIEILRTAPIIKLNQEDIDIYLKDKNGIVTGSILEFNPVSGTDELGKYLIKLPSNVVRVTEIKFPKWGKPVVDFTTPDTQIAKMQNVYVTMGKLSKPVVILKRVGTNANGYFEAHCYSHPELTKKENEETFVEEPTIKVINYNGVEKFDDFLIEPLTLLTASKVFLAIQNGSVADYLYKLYLNNIAN